MSISISNLASVSLLALLRMMVAGVEKHAALWPPSAPSLETLRALLERATTRQTEMETKRAEYLAAREAFTSDVFHTELVDSYRLCRNAVRALFSNDLLDFGLKPKAIPSQYKRSPRSPVNLGVELREEREVRLNWKPLPDRPIYEVFLAGDSPEAQDQMVATTTSSWICLLDLEPGHLYHVRIRAKRSGQVGPKSDPVVVSMGQRNLVVRLS